MLRLPTTVVPSALRTLTFKSPLTPVLLLSSSSLSSSSLPVSCRALSTAGGDGGSSSSSWMKLSFVATTGIIAAALYNIVNSPDYQQAHRNPTEPEAGDSGTAVPSQLQKVIDATAKSGSNPQCYFDVAIGEKPAGRMVFELFYDKTPLTAENFKQLCLGKRVKSYESSTFHRIIPGFMVQGGDVTRGDGTGGISIYGRSFPDESFSVRHSEAGLLSMANSGPNTNSSQFFILTAPAPHLDGRHVVFGKVVSGMDVLKAIESKGSRSGRPSARVEVVQSGVVKPEGKGDAKKKAKKPLKE